MPLSDAQRRLWLVQRLQPSSTEYNLPEALRIRHAIDIGLLREAMNAIVARHEILRTRFVDIDDEPAQAIDSAVDVGMSVDDLGTRDDDALQTIVASALREEWERPFDLARGPLLRLRLLTFGDRDHVLVRTFHHIVFDGWSRGIVNRELQLVYRALRER